MILAPNKQLRSIHLHHFLHFLSFSCYGYSLYANYLIVENQVKFHQNKIIAEQSDLFMICLFVVNACLFVIVYLTLIVFFPVFKMFIRHSSRTRIEIRILNKN